MVDFIIVDIFFLDPPPPQKWITQVKIFKKKKFSKKVVLSKKNFSSDGRIKKFFSKKILKKAL
jgi:hypothetical protein